MAVAEIVAGDREAEVNAVKYECGQGLVPRRFEGYPTILPSRYSEFKRSRETVR